MLSNTLSNFYERDIRKLMEEISLFRNEDNLWKNEGGIKNSAGNLALHIIGGSNYFFGAILSNTGYIRNRAQEFAQKDVPRQELIQQLETLVPLIKNALNNITETQMDEPFAIEFDGAKNTASYVLVQLLAHLNYHLGQVNYLRRILEV